MWVGKVVGIEVDAPEIRDDGASLGNKHPFVHEVFGARMRRPAENRHRSPSERFIDDGANIRKVVDVLISRHAIFANDGVQLFLGPGDERRAERGTREHERG